MTTQAAIESAIQSFEDAVFEYAVDTERDDDNAYSKLKQTRERLINTLKTPTPKFVQISTSMTEGGDESLYALDQDGTVWEYVWRTRKYGMHNPEQRIMVKGWHPLVMDRHQG